MSTNDGGPAFPCMDVVYPNGYAAQGKPGMSLRDRIAIAAMAAIIPDTQLGFDAICTEAYQYADAMLRAREQRT